MSGWNPAADPDPSRALGLRAWIFRAGMHVLLPPLVTLVFCCSVLFRSAFFSCIVHVWVPCFLGCGLGFVGVVWALDW